MVKSNNYYIMHGLYTNVQLLRNMKRQFAGLLYDAGFIQSSNSKDHSANVHSDNHKLVKAILCAGLYPNVVKIVQNKPHTLVKQCCVV